MRVSKAIFTNDAKSATAHPHVWQWDFGKIIKIYGLNLPDEFEAHLYEAGGFEALVLTGTENSVMIPDAYLESGKDLTLYLYFHEQEDDGETLRTVYIPVHKRAKPDDKMDQGSNHVEGEHRKYINLYATADSDYEHWLAEEDMGSASYIINYGTPKTVYVTCTFLYDELEDEQSWSPYITFCGLLPVAIADGGIDMDNDFYSEASFEVTVQGNAGTKAVGAPVFDADDYMEEPDPEVRFVASVEVVIESDDG